MKRILFFIVTLIAFASCNPHRKLLQANKTAQRVFISQFSIDALRLQDRTGAPYDSASGPDIYLKVSSQRDGKKVYYKSPLYQDIEKTNFPMKFTMDKTMKLKLDDQVIFEVYEVDPGKEDKCIYGWVLVGGMNLKRGPYPDSEYWGEEDNQITVFFKWKY